MFSVIKNKKMPIGERSAIFKLKKMYLFGIYQVFNIWDSKCIKLSTTVNGQFPQAL